MKRGGMLRIDYTHTGRRKTGIERITQELFSAKALADIPVKYFKPRAGRISAVLLQMLAVPLSALFRPWDVFIFPGFPPSPLMALLPKRCVLYIHDVFLLTRRSSLNFAAKAYLAPLFAFAMKSFKYFFVNSQTTGRALRAVCRKDAHILIYRPQIRNVFDLSVRNRCRRASEPDVMRVAAIGTVEPRKNYIASANICAALSSSRGGRVELNIIGRPGWGSDWSELLRRSGVILHGALSDVQVRDVIESADIFICSSHDEGLGLPLLEVQYGGLPTVAPDQDVFREVLGDFGIYIDPNDFDAAAWRPS